MNVNGGGINTIGINTQWENVDWLHVNHGDINVHNGHGINTSWMNANWIKINDTAHVQGIQMGRVYNRGEGYFHFPKPFVNDSVFIFTSRLDGNDGYITTVGIRNVSRWGFNFYQRNVWNVGNWCVGMGQSGEPFSWIAFCC
jgi:hypothetical protein